MDLGYRPEWLNTKRGLIGVAPVATPAGLISGVRLGAEMWAWCTEAGDSGCEGTRAYAIASAYVALVRATSPASNVVAEG
jgi:hypothetical protein